MIAAPSAAVSPAPSRINVRLTAFFIVVASPFVWFAYVIFGSAVNGGVEQHDGYAIVDLQALGKFRFDEINGTDRDIPARWRALDGKRVVLEGFAVSDSSARRDFRDFQFVYDVQKCCFGAPPQVQERVFALVPRGRTVPYVSKQDQCRLTGILHVAARFDEAAGRIPTVYTLEVEKFERLSNNLSMAAVIAIGVIATAAIGVMAVANRGR